MHKALTYVCTLDLNLQHHCKFQAYVRKVMENHTRQVTSAMD